MELLMRPKLLISCKPLTLFESFFSLLMDEIMHTHAELQDHMIAVLSMSIIFGSLRVGYLAVFPFKDA